MAVERQNEPGGILIRPPVLPGERYQVRRLGAPRAAGAAAYVWRDAAESLIEAAQYRPDSASFCVLLGSPFMGPLGVYTEIRGYAEWGTRTDEPTFMRELLVDWRQVQNRARRGPSAQRIVGWALARAGCNGELGPAARMVHRTLFHLPYAVVVCIDPQNRVLALHGMDAAGSLHPIGFNLVSRRQAPASPEISS